MLTKKYPPLYISINKELLNMLLVEAKKNFFNFLYYKTDYYFFKEDDSFISKNIFKKYKKLDKEQAFEIYNKTGFEEILNIIKNKEYKELFDSYEILYHLNSTKTFSMPITDLKLFLDIANISFDTVKEYEKNQ